MPTRVVGKCDCCIKLEPLSCTRELGSPTYTSLPGYVDVTLTPTATDGVVKGATASLANVGEINVRITWNDGTTEDVAIPVTENEVINITTGGYYSSWYAYVSTTALSFQKRGYQFHSSGYAMNTSTYTWYTTADGKYGPVTLRANVNHESSWTWTKIE